MIGYYKIARHYKWALTQIFDIYSYKAAIIIEDDLELAPDFFSYMKATYSLLLTDPSLMCVSAWNDNGKEPLIDVNRNDLLYRTDFFPGLGWMLTADLWRELKPKWPASYWDDWLRKSEQRNGRSCIRPEISRSQTFGKVGISNGQYFNKHLKFIFANKKPYDFEKADLSYLLKENYDKKFTNKISKLPAVSFNDVNSNRVNQESIVKYSNEKEFVQFAKKIGLMSDTRVSPK
jgi:alpha-1,3-mannosyl-glycoprotein beta-1,2-N-acetylglucosaminyltransferase